VRLLLAQGAQFRRCHSAVVIYLEKRINVPEAYKIKKWLYPLQGHGREEV